MWISYFQPCLSFARHRAPVVLAPSTAIRTRTFAQSCPNELTKALLPSSAAASGGAPRFVAAQTESGVSREEIAQCLIDVAERRPVANRIALRELRRELQNWPDLVEEEERTAAGAAVTVGADAPEGDYDSPMAAGDLAKPAVSRPPSITRSLDRSFAHSLARLPTGISLGTDGID